MIVRFAVLLVLAADRAARPGLPRAAADRPGRPAVVALLRSAALAVPLAAGVHPAPPGSGCCSTRRHLLPVFGLPVEPGGVINLFIVMVLLWTTVRVPGLVRRYVTQGGRSPNFLGMVVRVVVVQQLPARPRPRPRRPGGGPMSRTIRPTAARRRSSGPGCPPTSTPPTRSLYGLTFRQLAILAVAAVVVYGGWRALHTVVPVPVLLGAAVVVGGAGRSALAVGRRDGLPLDVWLLAARPAPPQPAGAVHHRHHRHARRTGCRPRRRGCCCRRRCGCPPTRSTTTGRSPSAGARAAMVAATSVNLGAAHRRRAGRADRHVRPVAQLACPRRRRSWCRRSRSTWPATPAPSPRAADRLPHPGAGGGVRRPRRVPRRPRRTPGPAAPAGPHRHPHRRPASAASTPPAAAPTTPPAPCPASASPPAPSTAPAVTAALAAAADPYRPAAPRRAAPPRTPSSPAPAAAGAGTHEAEHRMRPS